MALNVASGSYPCNAIRGSRHRDLDHLARRRRDAAREVDCGQGHAVALAGIETERRCAVVAAEERLTPPRLDEVSLGSPAPFDLRDEPPGAGRGDVHRDARVAWMVLGVAGLEPDEPGLRGPERRRASRLRGGPLKAARPRARPLRREQLRLVARSALEGEPVLE